jgi:alpha-galactosidase
LSPAIWLAPIYVDTTDPSIVAHPEWFVRNKDDSPRLFTQFDGTKKAALDPTNDAARAFAIDQIKQLYAWGYHALKLDFLFGAGIAGRRQAKVTGMQSYALWMKAIREAVPDAHLVGCGAPLLPSVGWVDSMRTGADVAFGSSPVPTYAFLADEAKSTILRGFTDAWWSLDPDVVLLRDVRIGDVEAWTTIVASALSGGNYLLGDGRQAGDLRAAMALDPEVLAMTRDGRAARASDPFAETDPKIVPSPVLAGNGEMAIPHVWRKTSADGARTWTVVFGWLAEGLDVEITLGQDAFEIAPPTSPTASATRRPASSGKQHVSVAPRAARLFVSR